MINTKEILIECNLKTSVKNNDNSFTTTIGGGIKLDEGDSISIIDVAVNSKGIGSNLIQIPKSNVGSNIQTNKITLKVGKYITTGSRFCCPMPFDSYKIISQDTDIGYGYAIKALNINTNTFIPQGNAPYLTDFVAGFKEFRGVHQYFDYPYYTLPYVKNTNKQLGIKLHCVVAPNNSNDPSLSRVPYDIESTVFYDFDSEDCNIEIPFGYEQDENIARLITDQFHSGRINSPNDIIAEVKTNGANLFSDNGQNPSITNAFIKIKTANLINYSVRDKIGSVGAETLLIGQYKNSLYENLYHKDPKRWIYGEKLNHLGVFYPKQEIDSSISNVNLIRNFVLYSGGVNKGETTITNLTAQNLKLTDKLIDAKSLNLRLLVDFIKNNEKYINNNEVNTTPIPNSYEIDVDNWFIYFDIGRFNDENAESNNDDIASDMDSSNCLRPSWLRLRDNGGAGIDGQVKRTKIGYYSRYNEDIYSNKKLTSTQITAGYKFVEEFTDDNGTLINVKEFLMTNNLMFSLLTNTKDADLDNSENYLVGFFTSGYTDERTEIGKNSITNFTYVYKKIAKPSLDVYNNQYFGFDPTFMRNTIAIAINTMKIKTVQGTASEVVNNYINCLQVGSPNSALQYDSDLNRFGLTDLHFPYFDVVGGNGVPNVDLMKGYKILAIPNGIIPPYDLIPFPKLDNEAHTILTTPIYWGYGGSTILDIVGNTDIDKGVFLNNTTITPDNFNLTFLNRMGFSYEDLMGIGSPDVLYNALTAGDFVKYPYQTPNPLTTNAKIITTYDYALGVSYTDFTVDTTVVGSYDLNVNCNTSTSTNADSVLITASNLPTRLDNPYWLIQSNIIPSSNYVNNNGKKQNILSVVNRAYTSNDYAYGMGSTTSYEVENPSVITEITTRILNNDFSSPDLDDGCVVVYKIVKNYKLLNEQIQYLNSKSQK